jgi:hypothetical protein
VIIVPTPEVPCRAGDALRMEGLEILELMMLRENDYGYRFSEAWDLGSPFVVVEWDIIPWPGAVMALIECDEPYCTHRYPLHRGNVTRGTGIGKYVPQGEAPEIWAQTPWHQLDGEIVPFMNEHYGPPHVHEPPVAHARRELAT